MITRLLKGNRFITKNVLYIYHKLKNRHLVKFWYSSYISHRCEFEGMNLVGNKTSFYGKLGKGSYIGESSSMSAYIGRFTSIGPRCTNINGFHPYKEPFVTTSPFFYSLPKHRTPNGSLFAKKQMIEEFKYYDQEHKIVNKIGSDVWIGADVCLLGSVEIGDGAVLLSRTIVTKNVPPYAIVGGIPAKITGYRYDQETIDFLLKVQWWNNSDEWLEQNWELLCDIEKFKEYYDSKE